MSSDASCYTTSTPSTGTATCSTGSRFAWAKAGYSDCSALRLLGRNGAGRSTSMNVTVGLLPPRHGAVTVYGPRRHRSPARKWLPTASRWYRRNDESFAASPCAKTWRCAGCKPRGGRAILWMLNNVHEVFPRLAHRQKQMAGSLSGGEQQILAIARSLMANPRVLIRVLIMDEPSKGLAPQIVAEVMSTIRRLKEQGLSIVLVEQNAKLVFNVADDIVILNSGRVLVDGPCAELQRGSVDLRQHLGIY